MYKLFRKPFSLTAYLILLGLLAILPFLLLNLYNHPANDDFGFATRDVCKDFLTAQADLYRYWSGRYFGTASSRINPIINYNFTAYKIYSFVVIVIYITAFIFFFRSILSKILSFKNILAISLLVVVVLLVTMPDIAQGLYWFSGYITYLGASIYTLFLFGILVILSNSRSEPSAAILKSISFVLVFAIAGSNELSMIILNATLQLLLIAQWQLKKRVTAFHLSLFVFALLLGLVVVLAPGNFVRMDGQEKAGNLLFALGGAGLLTFLSLLKWGFLMLIFSLLYLLLWARPVYTYTKDNAIFSAPVTLTIIWYLSTNFVMHFLFTYATGFRASTRVENVIHFFFIFGWFYLLQVIVNKYGHLIFRAIPAGSPLVTSILAAMFTLQTFSLESNVTTAYLDLISGRAATFNRELNARYRYLKTSDCTSCPITPVTELPKSLYIFNELRPDEVAEMGITDDFAVYWGKQETYLTGPTPAVPDNLTILKNIGKRLQTDLFAIEE